MKPIAILSVDHTKARFYILKPADRPAEQWSPVLCPIDEFINVHWLEQEKEHLSGGNRMSYHARLVGNSNTVHGYDDHLDSHRREIDKRFSREINNRLRLLLQEFSTEKLIIAAEGKILGKLREQMGDEYTSKIQVDEVTLNLCHLKPNCTIASHVCR
jgi:protein required for attachment to host cells